MASKSIEGSFRDRMTTSTNEGGRRWLYPELVKGRWFFRRAWVAYGLLFSLVLGPFWEWNGHPLFLFDLVHRQFIVFGLGFGPQDMNLFVFGILTFAVFIFAFTQVFGRFWCGWACPQTIFLEWVFRPIERLIEGNASARKRLDSGPNDGNKIVKKGFKLLIFWVISFAISNVFLAYLVGKKTLFGIISESPALHWGGLLVLLIFTSVFFFVFSRLRELACILICPYGRLQGTLQDQNSLTVAYHALRGEPRGHKKADSVSKLGDCVDCDWCVKVCPTGIDIRNGNQMECIQCTACIDACDEVMEKINRPLNLIGYYSENGIQKKQPFRLKTKGLAYFGLWAVMICVFGSFLILRKPIETIVLRTPGSMGFVQKPGQISNLYNFEVVNKTFENQKVEFVAAEKSYTISMVGQNGILLAPQEEQKGSFFITFQSDELLSKKTKIKLWIRSNGKITETLETQFFFIPKSNGL